jgi:NAD-dependent dihydropyrimidine dehydrogenase PreA subunit
MATRVVRKIVRIDEEKCNGCGLCIPGCKEGALQIIDGKARLVSEVYCDGLGACLGHCPQGAISIIEEEAEEFDERAVEEHLKSVQNVDGQKTDELAHAASSEHGCPGARIMSFAARKKSAPDPESAHATEHESALAQWPVQLTLVPVRAPYLQGADLLIAADCVPFAYANFHNKLLEGKALLIACPKLDETGPYVQKLARIFSECNPMSITIAHMEVPCCFGIGRLVQEALRLSGKPIPVRDVTVSIQGEVCGDTGTD